MSDVLDKLSERLQTLAESGAGNFSPQRFYHLQLMAEKAQAANARVSLIVGNNALASLALYADDFNRAKIQAVAAVEKLASDYPDAAEQLRALLDDGRLNEIEQLKLRLSARQSSPFLALSERLNQQQIALQRVETPQSFTDVIAAQQKKVLEQFDVVADTEEIGNDAPVLKAFLGFKKFKEKYDTDKLVEQLINERPANMGPLNPHSLLVKSIESMRDLSPHYVSRFITYIDTLLRLEDAGKKPAKRRRK